MREQAVTWGVSKDGHQFLEREDGVAALEVDAGRGRAERGAMGASEASDGAAGEGGPMAGAVELGGIEGKAGQSEPRQGDGGIPAPALAFEIPAFFELTELVVLDVPARTVGLVGGEARRPGTGTDQRERRL